MYVHNKTHVEKKEKCFKKYINRIRSDNQKSFKIRSTV